ncbi:hypothetical protein GUITHDRAFT_152338 [Guillardia theta CCMP2712]|uniref:Uncharacterized protein n=1 Tax=Guillardia theta (strain CCMP2712) TaxID=905079 RepID=L1JDL8_GUITC|nr:hypothetical protein GUITHDRAFT_152338 [Guillardia theta CCMP2712]EKX46382.1 hypothetical protein GUITHDRAFT_152338 [Guillardia theta CCMP2712]|eukprot:XP_005833362.1 hypothetical protein GUITHDRAFT_152338 [Guillardia theta CCMP2712]
MRCLGDSAAFPQDLSDLESPLTPDPSVASPLKFFSQSHSHEHAESQPSETHVEPPAKTAQDTEKTKQEVDEWGDEFEDPDSIVRVVFPTRQFIQVRGMLARSNELVKLNEQIAQMESELKAIRIKKKFNADQITWKHEIDRLTHALLDKVKTSRQVRWGSIPQHVDQQLTLTFRRGLMMLAQPAAFSNEMLSYILSLGSDWDSLLQTLSLGMETIEEWTGQPRSSLALRTVQAADELLWDEKKSAIDASDYNKEEADVLRDLRRVKRSRMRLLLFRGLRSGLVRELLEVFRSRSKGSRMARTQSRRTLPASSQRKKTSFTVATASSLAAIKFRKKIGR